MAQGLGVARSTVADYLRRAEQAGLRWPLPAALDDDTALEALLFPENATEERKRPEPDWARICLELKRKGVTKQLLWEEYRAQAEGGYQYSQFCDRYAQWEKQLHVTMRQDHRAGEKMFVDFSGDGYDIVDPGTGEKRRAKLFIAVLGGSGLTYVEAVFDESLPTWTRCHVNALNYFGGVPELFVPDNLRAAVDQPNRYEPLINRTYADLASHYGALAMPARVRKPRDKAKVEQAVLLAQRWILAVLRHRRLSSLVELGEAIDPLMEKLNNRVMRKFGKSRREIFDSPEKQALRPLPPHAFEYAVWSRAMVPRDYHVAVGGHYYSVPYNLVGQQVEMRTTAACVEILLRNRRVASHQRQDSSGNTTDEAHMPAAHRAHREWTPSRIEEWAGRAGGSVAIVARTILERKKHPQQGYQSCLGIIRLGNKYGNDRLNAACERAVELQAFSYRSIEAMLRNNRDKLDADEASASLPAHGNVRGADYYLN